MNGDMNMEYQSSWLFLPRQLYLFFCFHEALQHHRPTFPPLALLHIAPESLRREFYGPPVEQVCCIAYSTFVLEWCVVPLFTKEDYKLFEKVHFAPYKSSLGAV